MADSFRLIGKRSDNSSVFIIEYLHLWWLTLLRNINLTPGKEFIKEPVGFIKEFVKALLKCAYPCQLLNRG